MVPAAAACLLLAACAGAPGGGAGVRVPSGEPALTGHLTVLAAASLQDAFTAIGDDLMAANPGLEIAFSFGSSGTLAQQVVAGAPADVFASASAATMEVAAAATGEPRVFARNSLVVVTPRGNAARATGLRDLADPGLTIALCDPAAPCGAAALAVVDAAGLTAAPDTLGQDARATLRLVTSGEVDAAMVYATDALAAGDAVETIAVPEAAGVVNDYPIAVVSGSRNPDVARAFVDDVLSPAGQRVLTDAGFEAAR